MLLDLGDERFRARTQLIRGDRVRLVLEYPAEDRYRNTIRADLAELLRPAAEASKPARSGGGRSR